MLKLLKNMRDDKINNATNSTNNNVAIGSILPHNSKLN